MSEKLAFIAPYRELADLVRSIAAERKENILVFQGILEQAVKIARGLEHQGVGAIISRGPSVDVIRQNTSLPVIRCDPAGFDLLKAFYEARQYDRNIGLITFFDVFFDKKIIEDILGISIHISKICRNTDDIRLELEWAAASGLKVVVGGSVTTQLAGLFSLKSVMLHNGPETVLGSIEKAKEVARASREDRAGAERFRIILDSVQDGIISIDRDGIITVFNPMAEEILGVPKEEAIGEPLAKYLPDSPVIDGLNQADGTFGELVSFGGIKAVNNRVPIIVNNEIVGVVSTYQDVTQLQKLEAKVRKELNKKGLVAKFTFADLVGESRNFQKTLAMAREFAKTNSTVLIVGETGSGKELLAQSIHRASPRRNGPFVAVNCSALPESLLESELFGYEEGAFTGARRGGKQGLFELAHGGTIYLDEIAETSLQLQARLLRVVEEKEVMRVGGDQVIPLDVRIIASTNQELRKAVLEKRFRADLHYRLNVLRLKLPPLRERTGDIPLLLRHFLARQGLRPGEADEVLAEDLIGRLIRYSWPGNVRELEHFVERMVVLYRSVRSIPFSEARASLLEELRENEEEDLRSGERRGISIPIGTMKEMEAEIIRQLYRRLNGNKILLAQQLGFSRTTLWKKLNGILKQKES
ncbi:MAG: sigma 54-interacting transcriptional regulator [Bacillota bacterium]